MSVQPLPAASEPDLASDPSQPVPCQTCRYPVARDELGVWSHVGTRGVAASGWLCPPPHLRLATPEQVERRPRRRPIPIPPFPDMGRDRPSGQRTNPPQTWPPLTNDDWWQRR
ncbi:MAG TPA: hypothetical protein VFZ32_00520 [Micromonosporaceae bacterium]